MAWITDEELGDRIAAQIGAGTNADLDDKWDEIKTAALRRSRGLIRRALLARGFTIDQISDWDDIAEYHSDQAMYEALTQGVARMLITADLEAIKLLDRRTELATVPFTIDDVVVEPETDGATGGFVVGEFDPGVINLDTEW